jgi:hypothetical protein
MLVSETKVRLPGKLFLCNHQVCNGCGGHKMQFIFKVSVFLYIYFSLFIFRMRKEKLVSHFCSPMLVIMKSGDAWHFEVLGLHSIALEFMF